MIIIDGIIFSLQKSGGISVYFDELIWRLNNHDEKFLHLLYENKNNYTKNISVNSKVRLHIELERFRRVKVAGGKDDIFHSSYYRLPDKKFDGKVITTVHDFTEDIYPRGINSKILNAQKRTAILNSDGLICISENTKKDMHNFIPESKKIPTRVIYNGVGDFSVKNTDGKYDSYVIFVGARGGYKNFDMCVSSLEDLHDVRLVVVGGGKFTDDELKLLDSKIVGRYAHAGFISEQELESLYQNALALVYPSYYEGFGIPVIEAMKSGCPVIASKSSSIIEISANAAILFENITAEKIKQGIVEFKNHDFRMEKILSGIDNAENYSWDKMALETLEFYNCIRGKK
ncbi:glycosyltransferase family 4 protein [Cedecea sp. S5-13]|uniref:glycosyltransferase family 4 protein n=1 Tax=Cedecea selenatireducens TaxID=3144416 RepID=UPI0035CD20E9